MAQRWLHYGSSKGVPQNPEAAVLGRSGRINLAQTVQLSDVVIALHSLQSIQKSFEISPSELTVLLPFHGAGIGCQCWISENFSYSN